MTTQLPDKPSELIRLALADLEKCEVDEQYEIKMNEWHKPANDKCQVCLAGAVMAKTLCVPIFELRIPDYETDTDRKLSALDNLRTGYIDLALEDLGLDLPEEMDGVADVVFYEDNRDLFKSHMRSMADMLESHGL